jgi:hypothetical protein
VTWYSDRKRERTVGIDWFAPPALKLHAALIGGVALSSAATWLEWTRARSGHEIAWIYTFEWPLFALMGIYLWWKLLRPETPNRNRQSVAEPDDLEHSGDAPSCDDPGLAAWEAYLSRLHAVDPPGGPPVNRA